MRRLAATLVGLAFFCAAGCKEEPRPSVDVRVRPVLSEFEIARAGAAKGSPEAQRELGLLYLGGDGVPKDADLAVFWLRKAAEQGDDAAQNSLGLMHFTGEALEQDTAQAVHWWQKAAASGNGDAQANLGLVYFHGVGIAADPVLGYAWSNLAARQGIERARDNRDHFAKWLTPAQLARAQRQSASWQAQIDRIARETGRGAGGLPGRLQKISEGTLFVINREGMAVTANHAIEGCSELRVRNRGGRAKIVATDRRHDLALLDIPGQMTAAAALSSDPGALRQGDSVIVFGFPLNSVLASGGNLTPGIVSALSGLGNDPNQIQITAPIQPGSSGSPLLNDRGVVIGVVSMSLSNARMIEATGAAGQNVNFAVSGLRLNAFLDKNKADYERGGGFFSVRKSSADIADDARRWTLVLECWK